MRQWQANKEAKFFTLPRRICRFYILLSLNHASHYPLPHEIQHLMLCCSFNDLKFILYLKRGRRAEEKLTKASTSSLPHHRRHAVSLCFMEKRG